jgi:hypothetical protein
MVYVQMAEMCSCHVDWTGSQCECKFLPCAVWSYYNIQYLSILYAYLHIKKYKANRTVSQSNKKVLLGERGWWRLFLKRVVRIKLDICIFISRVATNSNSAYNMMNGVSSSGRPGGAIISAQYLKNEMSDLNARRWEEETFWYWGS